jgi:hypothetical protein
MDLDEELLQRIEDQIAAGNLEAGSKRARHRFEGRAPRYRIPQSKPKSSLGR